MTESGGAKEPLQPGLLVAEPFSWKTLVTANPLLHIRTTGTRSSVLCLPEGYSMTAFSLQMIVDNSYCSCRYCLQYVDSIGWGRKGIGAIKYLLALLSNGPGGPGPRALELQRAPERLPCNFLLRHHKQNGANSSGRIECRINSEFST